jgi:hypothetical protein
MPVSEQMPATALRFGRAPGALAVPRSRHGVAASAAALLDSLSARGDLVVFSPYVLHHRPDWYPQPHPFGRARWLAPSPELRASYLPFGAGATRCIEEEFGLAEAHPHPGLHGCPLELGPEAGTTVSLAARAVLVLRAFPVRLTARSGSGCDTLPVQVVMAPAATCATSLHKTCHPGPACTGGLDQRNRSMPSPSSRSQP